MKLFNKFLKIQNKLIRAHKV